MNKIIFCLLVIISFCGCQNLDTNSEVRDDIKENVIVEISTTAGNIEVELFYSEAPVTVSNFVGYIEENFYDGLIFHRVIKDFMIQGGGFDEKMARKEPANPIKNEATNGLKNYRGTIAMARTTEINSATSQFFINLKDNDSLNHTSRSYGYAVFGKVTKGMDVVDKIGKVTTSTKKNKEGIWMDDVPVKPIKIVSVQIKQKETSE